MQLEELKAYNEKNLFGRYITLDSITPILNNIDNKKILGYSYFNRPIYKVKFGVGKRRILIWSQMHGNESTGTKAIFDLFNLFFNPKKEHTAIINSILKECTLLFIPLLNPDGAVAYTRVNAQEIDLNRDAVDLVAPESKLLNNILHHFKPDYCFNLHDQRPIFSVGKYNLPATMSFLAPSEDMDRTVTEGRKQVMQVIIKMTEALNQYIPNQLGRYTDEFYPTATGDNFQKAGFNTILIESGHYPNDYLREETRKFTLLSLISGILFISKGIKTSYDTYFDIPNNKKNHFEFLLKNVLLNKVNIQVGVFFEDVLQEEKVVFIKRYRKLPKNESANANQTFCKNLIFNKEDELVLYVKEL